MSHSRKVLKSFGSVELNKQILYSNTTGTLFVNNVNVDINRTVGYTGGNGGLTFTSFNDEPENNLGGQFIVLNATITQYLSNAGLIYFNGSTDYVEVYTIQNTVSTMSIGSDAATRKFTGALVRSAT